jgi:hypothetical protein
MAMIMYSPPPPLAPPDNGAQATVESTFSEAGSLAQSSQSAALAAIADLGAFEVVVDALTVPDIPVPDVTVPAVGTAPTAAAITASFPAAPTEPTLGTLAEVDLGDAPCMT